jgi:transposase-like protein
MIIQVLHCPHCQSTDIVRHGITRQGKQRYRCRPCRQGRGRTFLLDYASGIRDTARVLHVSPTTVINELKKKNLSSSR